MVTSMLRSGYAAIVVSTAMLLSSSGLQALDSGNPGAKVVVTPLASVTTTASGQPIVLPQKNVQVLVSSFEIPPGAKLPVHEHPSARYAYVLAGNLEVTNVETGKSTSYKKGDFIVEMIGEWHQGANVGAEPVQLLVIDQVEEGTSNTVLKQ
ncbi:quercetin dioxygenase-like cupin family protein [Aminobacter aganoensis]|uniref:Quercetin dioxygenase-like cupin family protein n=2 Tax=Aminobacter aganoensis TaxID=83264 RepID=A0A7X0KIV3_9HYPH|nr:MULTISPECIES: cupin domain-containing protein [Aminobacter]MBB6352888.1 quercetin dioxygenase-like cupin family protein [Aminobacter aganoensis]